ncbi:MAG: short-chain fatty acyl-CoA regulator family protein [Pseudomonadota bacterium]
MSKMLIGSKLRRLRRGRGQTQAEMAEALGLSTSYINLLENNQRSLSVKVLVGISDVYGVDWREFTGDDSTNSLADLRSTLQDPLFGTTKPDLPELRASVEHAPLLVDNFLQLYRSHRSALKKVMEVSGSGYGEDLLQSSPEGIIHDFFRDRQNHFPELEHAAEESRKLYPSAPEDQFATLKRRLLETHGLRVVVRSTGEMGDALRTYDGEAQVVSLSQALDTLNMVFQLVHVLCLIDHADLLAETVSKSGLSSPSTQARLQVELANYFAAAYLMPYEPLMRVAENARYDVDRIATVFGVSFEQVCQRLTTLQREGARGVPFFFLRVDKAGNVTKRFNSTSFSLAEFGGSCPVWNVHSALYQPGVILPQFVEMPDGARYFSISRTVHRPVFSSETQDRRLTLALGCEVQYVDRIGYASKFNLQGPDLFAPIGVNCYVCPRKSCSQRAHQPLVVDLPLDANRRGSTRYES